MKDFLYLAPDTLEDAVKLLNEYKEKAVVLNGGTDVIVRMRDHLIHPDYVVDIKKIKELYGIHFDAKEGLRIGACATMNEIAENEDVKKHYPYLAKAVSSVGSKQIRNRATCVGNIVNASPLADSATPLLALDAVVEIVGSGGKREVKLRDFIVFVRKTVLEKDEIVTAVRVPYDPKIVGCFFKNSRRKEVDLSTVCGTVLKKEDEYRLALGSVAPTPLRLEKTEKLLRGREMTEELIMEACELAKTEVAPIDDVRASKQYRLDAVAVIVKRGIKILSKMEA